MQTLSRFCFKVDIFSVISVLTLGFGITSFGQTSGERPVTKKGAEAAAKNAVESAKEAVKPLSNQALSKADVARNKAYHLRTLELFKMRIRYLEKLRKGEIVPNEFLLEKVPLFKESLPMLSQLYKEALEKDTPAITARNTANLLAMLQPIGLILADADHEANPATLSKDQVAEAAQWQASFHEAMSTKDKDLAPLIFLKGQATYTLLHLKTPLLLRGKPKSRIYLESVDGGSFANGVNRIELIADDNGYATTYWISGGESIGEGMITAYSSGSPELIYHVVEVKQLKLKNMDLLTKPNKSIPKSVPTTPTPALPNPVE